MGKRRTPPLFDVIGATPRQPPSLKQAPSVTPQYRPASVAEAKRPLVQPVGLGGQVADGRAEGGVQGAGGTRWIHIQMSAALVGAAVLVAAVAAVWWIAYSRGYEAGRAEIAQRFPLGTADGNGTPSQNQPSVDPALPETAPKPQPAVSQRPVTIGPDEPLPLTDPRQAGFNYLILATLTYKDAENAVRFLINAGVPAAAVPAKGGSSVDELKSARLKNSVHLVIVSQGYQGGREAFARSAADRDALKKQVMTLGARWQKEAKGPTNFNSAYWDLYSKAP